MMRCSFLAEIPVLRISQLNPRAGGRQLGHRLGK